MPYEKDDLQTAVEMTIDHVLNKRSGPPTVAPVVAAFAQPAAQESAIGKLFDKAPGWITLLAAAVIGYSSLNTRLSTVEYQAMISISDRAELKRRVDKSDETLGSLDKHLAEIDVTLKELADRKANRNEGHNEN